MNTLKQILVVAGSALALMGCPQTPTSQVEHVPTISPQNLTSSTVVAWGNNFGWQSTVPAGLNDVIAIAAAEYHNLALKRDGTVVAWGCGIANHGQCSVPAGLSGVIAIAANDFHSLALKRDGTVVAWGYNNWGQFIPAGLSDVTAIAAGSGHDLALRSDGTVVAWGDNTSGQASVPAGLSNVTAIAGGGAHSLALKRDGTVVTWGYNIGGSLNVPAGLSNVTAIAAGCAHNLALKRNGTVVAWGCGGIDRAYDKGQCDIPAGLSDVTAIAAGSHHSLALKRDGTVVAWGSNSFGQSSVPAGLSSVTAIAAGGLHSLALVEVEIYTLAPSDKPSPIVKGWARPRESLPYKVDLTWICERNEGCSPQTPPVRAWLEGDLQGLKYAMPEPKPGAKEFGFSLEVGEDAEPGLRSLVLMTQLGEDVFKTPFELEIGMPGEPRP